MLIICMFLYGQYNTIWMATGSDALAAKCAGHELKSVSTLLSAGMILGLHWYILYSWLTVGVRVNAMGH